MNRRFEISLQRLALIALAVTLGLPGGEQVLCISDNGHIALEPPHPVLGCEDAGVPAGDSETRRRAVLASSACVDLSLPAMVSGYVNRGGRSTKMLPEPRRLDTVRDDLPWLYPTGQRLERDAPCPAKHRQFLRSTVLLI
jgi:hypothetical protein